MSHWQAWMACGLLLSFPAAAQADIFSWDNGQLIPGTEGITPGPGVDLSSPLGQWSSPQRNLRFADFSGGLDLTEASFWQSWLDDSRFNGANLTNASLQSAILTNAILFAANLTNADLSGADLTDADLGGNDFFYAAHLTNANLAGAIVTGAGFFETTSRGFTKEQLYSTASYQQKNLRGIGLGGNDLTGWDFSGQDLAGANFTYSQLTSANFAGAVVAGAHFVYVNPFSFGSVIALPQLYSTASYQQKNLRGIDLSYNDLTGGDFSGQDLTDAYLYEANLTNADLSGTNLTDAILSSAVLTNANLAGAMVTGAGFGGTTTRGFTKEQLYSTASYQQRNLGSIGLTSNNLTGWDFSGQDLAGADFRGSQLTNANFSFADLRGASIPSGPIQLARNTIRETGAINGLDLVAGETLVVRDSDIGITVNGSMNAISGGTLELVLADADWGSTMAVAAGITPDLGGTLRVWFADQANLAPLLGTTFDFFDWPAVLDANNRFDAIELPPGTQWDLDQLYLTGAAKLTAIPEPSAVLLLMFATVASVLARLRIPVNRR